MPKHRVLIDGDTLVKEILAGERDFERVILKKPFDINAHKDFDELDAYLKDKKRSDLKNKPLLFNEANLSYLKATGLYIPYTRASKARFYNADLISVYLVDSVLSQAKFCEANLILCNLSNANVIGANLEMACLADSVLQEAQLIETMLKGANLTLTKLSHAQLIETNLQDATLTATDLTYAIIQKVNFKNADLSLADFSYARIQDTKNLNKARYLDRAIFNDTSVDYFEEQIIKKALKKGLQDFELVRYSEETYY